MEMMRSKKGIYLTIIVVIVISIIISYSYFNDNTEIKQKGYILSNRAKAMDSLITDIEKDLERMILIAGYRSFLAMEKHVSDTEGFIEDINPVFSSLFINGSYNGTNFSLMSNATLIEWKDRIQEETDILNLDFDMIPHDIHLEHSSPWEVNVRVNATMLLTDIDIAWNYTKSFDNDISILDFEDPLYKIKTLDKVTNVIVQNENLDFINDSNNNTDNLLLHYNNSYYIASNTSPSFLMRFEGNLSPSTFGIESMVYPDDLTKQSLTVEDKSLIDYIYFDDSSSTTDYCNFDGMPSDFRIDSAHLDDYELDKIDYEACS